MLESFLAADRGFTKARKDSQLDGGSWAAALARQAARISGVLHEIAGSAGGDAAPVIAAAQRELAEIRAIERIDTGRA